MAFGAGGGVAAPGFAGWGNFGFIIFLILILIIFGMPFLGVDGWI